MFNRLVETLTTFSFLRERQRERERETESNIHCRKLMKEKRFSPLDRRRLELLGVVETSANDGHSLFPDLIEIRGANRLSWLRRRDQLGFKAS